MIEMDVSVNYVWDDEGEPYAGSIECLGERNGNGVTQRCTFRMNGSSAVFDEGHVDRGFLIDATQKINALPMVQAVNTELTIDRD